MEKSNYYTIQQVADLVKKHKYKLCECIDSHGKKVIPGHPANVKPEKWIMDKVKPWYSKPGVKEGAYYIVCYLDHRRKTDPDQFPIHVGEVTSATATPQPPINLQVHLPKATEKHISENSNGTLLAENEKNYIQQIADLKTQMFKIESERDEWKRRFDEIDDEHDKHLSEQGNKDFFKGLFEQAMPLADKFMDMQDKKNVMKFFELSEKNPSILNFAEYVLPQPKQQQRLLNKPTQSNSTVPNEEIQKMNEFMTSDKVTDEERARIDTWKGEAKDIKTFVEMLLVKEPDIYERMYNAVWGGAQ